MTDDEQEAFSHQHSHGVWVVRTGNNFAIFDHPNGHLIRTIERERELAYYLISECCDAAIRYKSRDVPRPLPASLDLGEMEIDL